MSPTRVVAAGDLFVRSSALEDAVRERCGGDVEVDRLDLAWPDEPFTEVAEVREASDVEDEVLDHLRGATALLTQMAPVTERILDACPDLRFVGVARGGPVNVNLDAARQHGVVVTNAPGRNAVATAEHTVAMLLAAARRIPSVHGDLRGGTWRGDYYRYDLVGPEVRGSTVGLVGLGAIGQRVATILEAFGARVLVHDPYLPDDHPRAADRVDLDELLASCGFVSLHARLSDDNAGMIGREQIARMPAGSVLVNCARGGLLDYDALVDALRDGHLFGAAVDVFPEEPVPAGSPLLDVPNLVVTPHLAGASRQTADVAVAMVADDLAAHLRGDPVAHAVT